MLVIFELDELVIWFLGLEVYEFFIMMKEGDVIILFINVINNINYDIFLFRRVVLGCFWLVCLVIFVEVRFKNIEM